jgi:hypothetical protein
MSNLEAARAVQDYPWDSETHKEAYLGWVQYMHSKNPEWQHPEEVDKTVAFFVLKALESNEYYQELFGTQFSTVRGDFQKLQTEVARLEGVVEGLKEIVKAQASTIDLLVKTK